MSEREKILGRIREALQIKAPLPGTHSHTGLQVSAKQPSALIRRWLPLVGPTDAEQLDLFAKNCAELKVDFQLFANREDLKMGLRKIAAAEEWKHIASHDGVLSNFACRSLGLPVLFTDGGYDVNQLEKCDVSITECDCLVAQTGGVSVTNRSTGGRALTILPPHHVVVAGRGQLVPDLPAAFELLQKRYASNFPSMISFITGPSRTGDIERILVLGAHGPKKLTILCS